MNNSDAWLPRIKGREPRNTNIGVIHQEVGLPSKLCDITGRKQHPVKCSRKMPIGYPVNLLCGFAIRATFGEYSDRVSSGEALKYFMNISARPTGTRVSYVAPA